MRRFLLKLFSHRLLAVARWDLHFLWLRVRNALTLGGRRAVSQLKRRGHPVYMNLGSGPRGLSNQKWINVEGFKDRNVHILLDASRPLPFPDSSIDGVFCEHVLEHFSFEDGRKIAAEVRRVLANGAGFRIVVPDAALVMRCYFEDPEALIANRGDESATAMEVVNLYFRQRYEHQFLYDWESMKKMLLKAGFSRVERQVFGKSQVFPHLVLDDKKYEWESLYVEASK